MGQIQSNCFLELMQNYSRNNLILRIFTVTIGLPLVYVLLFLLEPRVVNLCFGLFIGITTFEFARIILHFEKIGVYLAFTVCISTIGFFVISNIEISQSVRAIVIIFLLTILVGAFGPGPVYQRTTRCEAMLLSLAYPLFTWSAIWELYRQDRFLVVLALGIAWGSDTAAFFGGRRFGHHKLAPVISPAKTWEGALFGVVGALVFASIIVFLVKHLSKNWLYFLIFSFLGAIAAQMGDLLKSIFKRSAGVKDAGKLLPGHGGLLDRIDSFLLVSTCLWLFWT